MSRPRKFKDRRERKFIALRSARKYRQKKAPGCESGAIQTATEPASSETNRIEEFYRESARK